jgi:acyl-CoA thioesterase
MTTVELPSLDGSGVEPDPPGDTPDDFVPVNFDLATAEPPPFVRLVTEMRTPRPEGIYSHRPTEAWVRVFADLTPGRPLSHSAAVAAAADYGNALGAPAMPGMNLLFPNADLTVHLARVPEDAWVRMSPATMWYAHGIGHTRCDLWDRRGRLGTSTVILALANRT